MNAKLFVRRWEKVSQNVSLPDDCVPKLIFEQWFNRGEEAESTLVSGNSSMRS